MSDINIMLDVWTEICNHCKYVKQCDADEEFKCPFDEDEPGMGQWDLIGDD